MLQDHGEGVDVTYTYTRQAPAGWTGYQRRIDRAMLKEVTSQLEAGLRPYVCGPTLLVEAAANNLQELGIPAGRIRTERVWPTRPRGGLRWETRTGSGTPRRCFIAMRPGARRTTSLPPR